MITIRDINRDTDRPGVEAIDTGYETATVFDLVIGPRTLELKERQLETPLTKIYPIGEVFAFWARWETGWVALDGDTICGVAVVGYEPWHKRLTLWHLYIDRARRRMGIGRALLDKVEAYAREKGALRVWLETSTVNPPGVAAYEALAYSLVGADDTHYDNFSKTEKAIYLSKRV